LDKTRAGKRSRSAARKANGSGVPGAKQVQKYEASLLKQIGEIDGVLRELQQKIGVLDRALADGRLYAEEPQKAQKFTQLRAELQRNLESTEGRWLEAQGALDRLKG